MRKKTFAHPRKTGATHSSGCSVTPFLLFALFMVVLLLTLAAGVKMYASMIALDEDVRESRYGAGVLANSIRAADSYDAISATPGPEGEALVLTERTEAGEVQTRIYLSAGHLMQEYAVAGAHLNPGGAVEIMPTETFSFAFEDGLLTLTTDAGDVSVAIRSQEVQL